MIETADGKYFCSICLKTLRDQNSAKRHQREIHQQESEKFPCPNCSKTFKAKRYVLDHVRRYCNRSEISLKVTFVSDAPNIIKEFR